MTASGTFPKVDGDIFYAEDTNLLYNKNTIDRIDETTDLNITCSGQGTTDTANKEFTFASSYIYSYVEVALNGLVDLFCFSNSAAGSYITMKVEIQETGEAYAIVFNEKISGISGDDASNAIQVFSDSTPSRAIVALTAGMKTNGFVIKITMTCTSSGSIGGAAAWTNNYIMFRGIN